MSFVFSAPNFPSLTNPFTCNVNEVMAMTASISWAAPAYPPDADGYIIYYHKTASNDPDKIKLVNDGSSSEYVLTGLDPETNYTVSIRAFQDILGPPTEDVFFVTKGESS